MHDRRIDGQSRVFGNAGALFMNAMTWYDHETNSIWSQPWGRAIVGPLKGVELFVLPSQLTTWGNWHRQHPESLAMTNDVARLGFRRQGFEQDFVIGLLLGDQARAYPFQAVADAGILNDTLGDVPVLVWASGNLFYAYVRQAAGQTLRFRRQEGRVVDEETGSTWDISRGVAIDGPLAGQGLQPVPSSSAYDWAWRDFYPRSTFYEP